MLTDRTLQCMSRIDWLVKSKREVTTDILKSTYSSCAECPYIECEVAKSIDFTEEEVNPIQLVKSRPDEQLVFGWANASCDEQGNPVFDWFGDFISGDVLEKSAYNFVLKYRVTGEEHKEEMPVGELVESVMFTKEKCEAIGIPYVGDRWWVGFHIPDADVFAKIKSGQYKDFSIQGAGKRLPVAE